MTPPLNSAWLDSLLDAERHDEALDLLNAALEEQPDNARLYALRGDFWSAAWHHRDAAADWETALSLDPSLTETQLKLALLEITRPYRLCDSADGEDDLPETDDDGAGPDDNGEESLDWAELEQSLMAALQAGGEPLRLEDELPDHGEDDGFEAMDEDSIHARGLARLQALNDQGRLDDAGALAAAEGLTDRAWLPWQALDILQTALAANPSSEALQRAVVLLWMRLATDTAEVGDEIPVGYSADVTGNLYHPVSAATALQLSERLPAPAWDADLYERRAQLHRLQGDHEAAALDFQRAAEAAERQAEHLAGEARDEALALLRQLREEQDVSRGGDAALIAARQRQMQDTIAKLAEMQQSMGLTRGDDDYAPLEEARVAADEYIDTIGHDPAGDEDYVQEVCGIMPQIADAIFQTLESEPYDYRGLSERELFERVGEQNAQHYLAERAAFARLGFAAVGWFELQSLSRRLGQPAVLDLLLSPDHTIAGMAFVLGGMATRELHSLFADGSGLSHATIRGRSAGWTPPPFRQVHLPADTPVELLLRLHAGAVRHHAAVTGAAPVALQPSQLPEQFDTVRARRYEARLAHGFHDAELRGYAREHYRVAGETLRRELAARMAALKPRTH